MDKLINVLKIVAWLLLLSWERKNKGESVTYLRIRVYDVFFKV